MPVLPQLIEELSGDISSAAVSYGLIVSVYAAMQFIFGPLLGALSDRFGRRPVILFSLVGLAIHYVLLGLAPSLVWIAIVRGGRRDDGRLGQRRLGLYRRRHAAGAAGAEFWPYRRGLRPRLHHRAAARRLVGAKSGSGCRSMLRPACALPIWCSPGSFCLNRCLAVTGGGFGFAMPIRSALSSLLPAIRPSLR